METQRQFDWSRAEQLSLIRRAEIPSPPAADGKRTTAAVLKGVLRVLDDHGGGRECWVSYETIAAEACCGVRTAKRAVEILESLSLICVQTRRARSGGRCNHYRIVWTELALLIPSEGNDAAEQPCPAHSERAAVAVMALQADEESTRNEGATQSATGAHQSATRAKQSATGGTRSALKRPEAPPPPAPSDSAISIESRLAAAAGSLIGRIGSIRGILDAEWARGKSPEHVAAEFERLWAIASHGPNRVKWDAGPAAACVWRYRNGAWPADGIVDDVPGAGVEPDAATLARRTAEAETKRRSGEDCRAMEIVKAGRRQDATDEAIAAALARAGLSEACDRLAWRREVSPETRGDA